MECEEEELSVAQMNFYQKSGSESVGDWSQHFQGSGDRLSSVLNNNSINDEAGLYEI